LLHHRELVEHSPVLTRPPILAKTNDVDEFHVEPFACREHPHERAFNDNAVIRSLNFVLYNRSANYHCFALNRITQSSWTKTVWAIRHAGTNYRAMPQKLRPRVLLVDDNADLLESLDWLLKPSCEVVALLTDGSAVLESVMRLKPDVVVLDISMPDIHGFDLCRQIKRITPETRIVFLTAFDDEDVRNLAFSVGAFALVTKHSVDQLLVAIHGA